MLTDHSERILDANELKNSGVGSFVSSNHFFLLVLGSFPWDYKDGLAVKSTAPIPPWFTWPAAPVPEDPIPSF